MGCIRELCSASSTALVAREHDYDRDELPDVLHRLGGGLGFSVTKPVQGNDGVHRRSRVRVAALVAPNDLGPPAANVLVRLTPTR